MGLYEIVFWLTGIISVYSSYLIISAFSDNEETSTKGILITLVAYYVISNTVYSFVEIPILNLSMVIIFLTALSLQLNFNRKKRILTVVYTIFIQMIIEVLIAFTTGAIYNSPFLEVEYNSILGRVLIVILTYAVGRGLRNYKHIGKNIEMPISYWLTLIIFPVFSVILTVVIIRFNAYGTAWVTFGILIVLLMNMLAFYLYDRLLGLYSQRIEDVAIGYLNDSYKKQLATMKASISNTNAVQHDINRHLRSIQTLIAGNRYDEVGQYVEEIVAEYEGEQGASRTGNAIVDSIVNYELNISTVSKQQVQVESINLPPNLMISDYEMTIVVSNLVRNSLEAIKELPDGECLITIKYDKGILFIETENDFANVIKDNKGRLLSKKRDGNTYGYGLSNVKKVVEKYEGVMDIDAAGDRFKVKLMMYVDHE